MQKEPEDAMDYLDEIAENSNTWTGPSPMDSTNRTRTNTTTSSGRFFKLREDDNMSAKICMLTKEIKALKMKGSKSVSATFRVRLVGGVEKWEDRKWREDRKDLIFSRMCLVGRVEKWKDGKLFCLVEKKSKRIENKV